MTNRRSAPPAPAAWQPLGLAAPGGSIFGLAIQATGRGARCWAGSRCGLLRKPAAPGSEPWQQELAAPRFPLTSVYSTGSILLAGSARGELVRSADGGATWASYALLTGDNAAPISCLAGPSTGGEATILAGTDGGGVWRSEDGGRSWAAASFGLAEKSVQALLCAPDWATPVVLAGTADGLYRSTNGGRAWRDVDWPFDDAAILALALAAGASNTFYAGSEEGNIFRSNDGGQRWRQLTAPADGSPISALYVVAGAEQNTLLAGTEEGVFLSADGGQRWRAVCPDLGPVLCLAGAGQYVAAGSAQAGVWESGDGGQTWQPANAGLAGRVLSGLLAAPGRLCAWGGDEGVYCSADGGQTWQTMSALDEYLPLAAFVALPALEQGFLAAPAAGGLLRSADGGASWQAVLQEPALAALLTAPGGAGGMERWVWAAAADGRVLVSHDNGLHWSAASDDMRGETPLLLAASPHLATDHTLLLGTTRSAGWGNQPTVYVWRSGDGGRTWRKVLHEQSVLAWMAAFLPPAPGRKPYDAAFFAVGDQVLRPLLGGQDVWVGTTLSVERPNVLALAAAGDPAQGGTLYAASSSGIYSSQDGGRSWQIGAGSERRSFTALALDARTLYALELGGALWRMAV